MLIVEFCGTPGCGKTTLCDEIEQELQLLGYKVKNLQKRKYPVSFADKVAVAVERFCFRHAPCNRELKKALQVLRPYIDESSLINWPDRILEASLRIANAEKAGVQIGLFDEGCLQFITSVFHGKTVTEDVQSLIDVLIEKIYKERTIVFDCQMDETENYQRLAQRNKSDDRFLIGGKEISLRLLKNKRKNIDAVLGMVARTSNKLLACSSDFPTKEEVINQIKNLQG